jgi:hypothetical protein
LAVDVGGPRRVERAPVLCCAAALGARGTRGGRCCCLWSGAAVPPLDTLSLLLPPFRCPPHRSYPNLKTVRELVYKRGYGKVDKQRTAITDNSIVERELGAHGILCVEDLIHEIYTVGPHFKEANNFLWTFKLSSPLGGLEKKLNGFHEGGQAGNREGKINELAQRML